MFASPSAADIPFRSPNSTRIDWSDVEGFVAYVDSRGSLNRQRPTTALGESRYAAGLDPVSARVAVGTSRSAIVSGNGGTCMVELAINFEEVYFPS
jgi:hypothetical protein